MRKIALILLVLALTAIHCHEDHEGEEGHVHDQEEIPEVQKDGDLWILTEDNFEQLVMESEKPFFIKFFAPWCGHCKRLQPDWLKLATQIKETAIVAEVDCTQNKKLQSMFGIRGYPTLKFFPPGKKTVEKTIDYRQARTLEAFQAFVEEKIKEATEVPEEVQEETKQEL